MRVHRATLGLTLSLLWFGGCAHDPTLKHPVFPNPRPADGRLGDEQDAGALSWPFWPRSMRIHPLSQVVTDRNSGELIIEARIEFRDEHGHTAKALGLLRIDLHAVGESDGASQPLTSWTVDLRDLSINWERYDEVTLTYLLRLEGGPADLPEETELLARFLSSDGQRFEAKLRLRR